MSGQSYNRQVHLLYVPTLACNLGCRYCYLGEQTGTNSLQADAGRAVYTLKQALAAFLQAGVLPFNVSLHGGEPTMLPKRVLGELFTTITRHYLDHYDELTARGYRKAVPHIKTNLFNFHQLHDLFVQHRVSISASIDLPLALHGTYRTTRNGRSWLPRTMDNLRLLADYPHSKKISATFYSEHLNDIPAIIADIRMLHEEIGLDMNSFNVMFGFESGQNQGALSNSNRRALQPASEEQQLALYEALRCEFMGTALEEGLRRSWFEEFTPTYCTNSVNCGERFLLLQGDGSVWSCVRGQGLAECSYGNILQDPVEQILAAGQGRIARLHQQAGLADDCRRCAYLHYCHTGCPVVKLHKGSSRSYSCALQLAIYRDNPLTWPPQPSLEAQQAVAREYLATMHPALAIAEAGQLPQREGLVLTDELLNRKNSLKELVAADPVLAELYSDDAIIVAINEEHQPLRSQILSPQRTLYSITGDDRVVLHVRRSLFNANCSETVRNTLHLQLLRDTAVVYGDEQRSKQEHLFTHELYYRQLEASSLFGEEFVMADISGLLRLYGGLFRRGVLNNLFVTTGRLRAYHYEKQQANAFYHIQAINLPFQNLEFYWDE